MIIADLRLPARKIAGLFDLAEAKYHDGASRDEVVAMLTARLALDEPHLGDIEVGDYAELLADHPATRNGCDPLAQFEDDDELEIERSADPDAPAPLPAPIRLADHAAGEPLRFAVDRVLIQDDINGLVGDGDAGKSTLLLALFGAIAAGASALGELAAIEGPVLYVSGEDSAGVIRNRLAALAAGHRWDRARMLARFHVFDEGVDLEDLRWQLHLIEAARDLHTVAAAFDPLGDLCGDGVEENSNTDAKRVTRYLRHFMRQSGATPVLSMHVSKPAEGKERKHRVRGASAWRNATRLCWWVEAMDGGMELDPIKANRLPSRTPLQVKRTVTADPEHPMMWKAAHIALDTGGDVVGQDVLRVMRWVQGCQNPPTSNEVEAGDHGVPRDRARAALGIAHTRLWLAYADGPRRSRLWTASDAGRARLLLEGASA